MFNKTKRNTIRSMYNSGFNITEISSAVKLPEFITNCIISEIIDEEIEL